MKIAVLMGGSSFEREASLESGKNVCEALEAAGHRVVPLDTTKDLVPTLRSERPDVAYIALHGKHGEDGTIQSLLEFLDIPFVGSAADVARNTWDKGVLPLFVEYDVQLAAQETGASWPHGVVLARDAFKDMGLATALDLVEERVPGGYPVCVKPCHGGSALGCCKVHSKDELGKALLDALTYDNSVIIQQWIDGVELAVSIIGEGPDAHALPPVEIVVKDGLFFTEERMHPEAVQYHAPVRDESLSSDQATAQAIRAEVERVALAVYRAYGLVDLGRVDLIWDGAQVRVLEVNLSPGMSERSLFPLACEAAGLSFQSVMDSMVRQYER